MTRLWCDGPTLMRAVACAVANLERHVDEVDALNVFPVPDGDTGSNMLATMRAALAEAERLPGSRRDLASVAQALTLGALRGARGNSGVILSQIIRGMTQGADGRRRASGVELAAGLRHASEVAYRSVLTPVEGTILTVIRDTAEAAEAAAGRQPHVEEVLAAAIEAAARSVARTPSLLPVLEDAGVVDSGGQGLFRLLEGTFQLGMAPDRQSAPARPVRGHPARDHAGDGGAGVEIGQEAPPRGDYGFETTYLVAAEASDLDLDALRQDLEAVGESVVVAGDQAAARVHVHGQRPDLALWAGLQVGRISDVRIQDMDAESERHATGLIAAARHAPASQAPARGATARASRPPRVGPRSTTRAAHTSSAAALAVVAVATTAAQELAFHSVGVACVVRPSPGERVSAGEIAEAIRVSGAREVVVLPDDADTQLAARQASALVRSVAVRVLDTRNVAEGVAAALAFSPTVTPAQNVERMFREARALRTFSLASAARDALIDGRPVRRGHFIAFDGSGSLLAQDEDPAGACLAALVALGADGIELVTIYQGEDVPDAQAAALAERVAAARPGVEVEVVRAGQRGDACLVAVE